jgi:hypothetical protein
MSHTHIISTKICLERDHLFIWHRIVDKDEKSHDTTVFMPVISSRFSYPEKLS